MADWYFRVHVLVHLFRRESSARLTPTAEEKYFYQVRVPQLSLCSQVLPLPLGAPPSMLAAACCTQSLSGVWRVLITTDVGNITQGQGVPDHQVLPFIGAQH